MNVGLSFRDAVKSLFFMFAGAGVSVLGAQTQMVLEDIYVIAEESNVFLKEIKKDVIESYPERELPDVLKTLPGIAMVSGGQRNESMFQLRGFDLRQVPVTVDGVPVYVPYDGNMDLSFLRMDSLKSVQVQYGLGSVLNGPNDLGGRVNLVTSRPERTGGSISYLTEMDDSFETYGNRLGFSMANVMEKYFYELRWSGYFRDWFMLPDSFVPVASEDGGMREMSESQQTDINIKTGWKGESSEVLLSISKMSGEKQNPPYAGTDSSVSARYWDWPYYDKNRYYISGKKEMRNGSRFQYRLYRDEFKNSLYSWDDVTMTSMNKKYAFESAYDDYSNGMSMEYQFAGKEQKQWRASFHLKDDVHRENDELREPAQPWEVYKDRTMSFGIERKWNGGDNISYTAGLRYDIADTRRAEEVQSGKIISFQGLGDSDSLNPLIAFEYTANSNTTWFGGYSRRSRFPVMKDRFSYKMGKAIPNPFLKPDRSDNFELGIQRIVSSTTTGTVRAFWYEIDDLINMVSMGSVSQNQNLDTATRKGFDTSIDYKSGKDHIGLNYSFLLQDYATNYASPKHSVSVVWDRELRSHLKLMTEYYYASRSSLYDVFTATDSAVSEYDLLNVMLKKQCSEDMELQIGMRNILDEVVETTKGFPWPGRNLYLSATIRF
jgi:iron complex outermembrane receptor protein